MGDDQTAAERWCPGSLTESTFLVDGTTRCRVCGQTVQCFGSRGTTVEHYVSIPVESAVVPVSERPDQRLLDAIRRHREAINALTHEGVRGDTRHDRELWAAADAVEAVLSDTQTEPEEATRG